MKDATIGFLAGVIIAIGLTASSASSMRDDALADAAASGYLVHEQKAYRVVLVEKAPEEENELPIVYLECTDNGEWGVTCPSKEVMR